MITASKDLLYHYVFTGMNFKKMKAVLNSWQTKLSFCIVPTGIGKSMIRYCKWMITSCCHRDKPWSRSNVISLFYIVLNTFYQSCDMSVFRATNSALAFFVRSKAVKFARCCKNKIMSVSTCYLHYFIFQCNKFLRISLRWTQGVFVRYFANLNQWVWKIKFYQILLTYIGW